MLTLRLYQTECLEAITQAHREGKNRLLVSLPTGTGKTVVFAHLPQVLELHKKMLVLAHREELLEQAAGKILAANPEARVEIEQAERRADPEADVIVASVPSIGREGSQRIARFDPAEFGLIIADEAHRAIAPTWRNIFDHFGLPENKEILLVGFTATPRRGDGVGLEEVFDEIVYHRDIREMIREGYLSPITGYRVHTQTDLSKVHSHMGDFVQEELSEAINNASRNAKVVKSYLDRVPGRKAIVFAVNVQHAQDLAGLFQEVSIPCAAVTGEMDREVRREILEAFREGSIRVLTNCMVLSEGFDQPDIEAVILARPTQSSLLHTQMVGRGTRLAPGKERLTVIDIVDNSRRHSLVSLATLFGLPANLDLKGRDVLDADREIEEACEKHPGLNLDRVTDLESLRLQVEEFDFFAEVALPREVERYSRLTWFRMPDGSYRISLGKGEQAAIQQNLLGQYEITVLGERLQALPTELWAAFGQADRAIGRRKPEALPFLLKNARWRREDRATEKQLETLRKLGIAFPPNISKGEASLRIGKFFASRVTRRERRKR